MQPLPGQRLVKALSLLLVLSACQVVPEQDIYEWKRSTEEAVEVGTAASSTADSNRELIKGLESENLRLVTAIEEFRREFQVSLTAALVEERVRDAQEVAQIKATLEGIQAEIAAVKARGGVVTGNDLKASETELERAVARKINAMGMLTFLGFAGFLVFVFRERLGRLINRGKDADE